jgi:hypothetical protein
VISTLLLLFNLRMMYFVPSPYFLSYSFIIISTEVFFSKKKGGITFVKNSHIFFF